jgi:hypothetical protein
LFPGRSHEHLKSRLVETPADGQSFPEDNRQLNGGHCVATFAVAGGGQCRVIRLVNFGKNHYGSDKRLISA